jgi:aldehyde dehydrogenase (NAD+)
MDMFFDFGSVELSFSTRVVLLAASVAAGNKVTLKPSGLTPNTSHIISKLLVETLP